MKLDHAVYVYEYGSAPLPAIRKTDPYTYSAKRYTYPYTVCAPPR